MLPLTAHPRRGLGSAYLLLSSSLQSSETEVLFSESERRRLRPSQEKSSCPRSWGGKWQKVDQKPGPFGSKACTHWICCETYSGEHFLSSTHEPQQLPLRWLQRSVACKKVRARRGDRWTRWEPGPVGGGARAGRAVHDQVCGPGDAWAQGPSLPLMLVLLPLLPH